MKLDPSVDFAISLDGKSAMARVVEDVSTPVRDAFRVAFSDGYEDEFMLRHEFVGGSNLQSVKYAKAISQDIGFLIGLDRQKFYHVFQETINNVITNIWVIEMQDKPGIIYYAVYYNNFYRFELRYKKDHWMASTISKRSGITIDSRLVTRIGFLLDSLVR
jgi:hypothetical protein